MALKARTADEKNRIRLSAKPLQRNYVSLHRMAASIGEDIDYTLDQIIESFAENDKGYRDWLKNNPDHKVELPAAKGRKAAKPALRRAG